MNSWPDVQGVGTTAETNAMLSDFYYGASEASVVFRRLTEISEYERPPGRGHAFARLISLRIHVSTHPPGNVSLCVTVGVRLHVRTCGETTIFF